MAQLELELERFERRLEPEASLSLRLGLSACLIIGLGVAP